MASSGALNTSNSYIKYRIEVTEGTADVAANTSPVTVKVTFYRTNSGYSSYGTGTVYCKINGTTYTAAVTPSQKITSGGIVLFTKTLTITHDDDGGKTLPVTAWISHDVVTSSEQGFSPELSVIPRASQPSCITWPEHTQNVGEFGETISIHMNRKASAFTHYVYYSFGSISWELIGSKIETGMEWTIPTKLMNQLKNTTKGSGTIHVETWNGSKHIGTKSCGFTATVPENIRPTCSIQVLDDTDTKDTYGSLVKGLSKLHVKVTAATAYSSPIAGYKTTANGGIYTEKEFTTGVLAGSGTTTVSATVTDGRGRTSAAASASFPVLEYTPPSVTVLGVHRCDQDGTENDQGEYVQVTFSARVTSLNNKNSAAYRLKYKKSTASAYTTVNFPALAGKYYVADHTYIFAADNTSSYDVTVEAEDDIQVGSRATSASTGYTFMDWNADGKSIAFGKVSEESGKMEIAMHTKQIGNSFSFQPSDFNGEKGYTLLAVIKLNQLNVNAPIVFTVNRRGALCPMQLYVSFKPSSTSTDPDVGSFTYEGDNYGAFLYQSGIQTWKLYVDNTAGGSNPCLQSWYTTDNQMARISVEFPSEQVATLPQPWHRAVPAKMQSLLDYIYPVGSIYLSYSHVSPATLFGGTWARISNAFLWASDASATIGQTGGEKEHTLTVAEMPSHSHAINDDLFWSATDGGWASFRTGTQTEVSKAGLTTSGAGGGQAHNNMPPYVQVSAWRRTA